MTAPEVYDPQRQKEYEQFYRQGAKARKDKKTYEPPGIGSLFQQAAYCAGYHDEAKTMIKLTFPKDLTIEELKLFADDFGIQSIWCKSTWVAFTDDIDVQVLEEIHEKTGLFSPVTASGLDTDRHEIRFEREEAHDDQPVQAAA